MKTKELRSWTEQDGDEVKNFSGTAEYSISFTKPNDSSKTFLLDLGKVHETAEVFLNGKQSILPMHGTAELGKGLEAAIMRQLGLK